MTRTSKWVVAAAVVGLATWWIYRKNQTPDYDYGWAKRDNTAEAWRRYIDKTHKTEAGKQELARLQAVARAHIHAARVPTSEPLETLMGALLEVADYRIVLARGDFQVDHASFEAAQAAMHVPSADVIAVDASLATPGYECYRGISAAFAELTGSDVISVDRDGPAGGPRLTLAGTVRATGIGYASKNSRRIFPGFELVATVTLETRAGKLVSFDATATPGQSFKYTTMTPMFGADDKDVASGMLGAACRQLGDKLVEKLTGRATPVAQQAVEAPVDFAAKCEDGDAEACVKAGLALQPTDRRKAGELFEKGCRSPGLGAPEACLAEADLALSWPTSTDPMNMDDMDHHATATLALDQACQLNLPAGCRRRGELSLLPRAGRAPSAYEADEAIVNLVRACDLGEPTACYEAAKLMAAGRGMEVTTPSPARARVLAARGCAGGSRDACADLEKWPLGKQPENILGWQLGKGDQVFDVRFGSWFNGDKSVVVWVAAHDPGAGPPGRIGDGGAARSYALDKLPPGPKPPAWARAVYALTTSPRYRDARDCLECQPGAETNELWPRGCICLPPAAAPTP